MARGSHRPWQLAAWLLCGAVWAGAVHADSTAVRPADAAPVVAPGAAVAASEAATLGRRTYDAACSACHGATGRGGRGGAPDLMGSPYVAGTASAFAAFVRAGVPARGMPPFNLDDAALTALHTELQAMSRQAARRGARTLAIVGDVGRGKSYFEGAGRCTQCHAANGDLQGIGVRYTTRVLQGRIVLPRGSGVHPGLLALGVTIPGVTDGAVVRDTPPTVQLRWPGGRLADGTLLALSDFHVAWRDATGRHQSATRRAGVPAVVVHDPAQAHIDRLGQVADRDLHDLTAYLASLK